MTRVCWSGLLSLLLAGCVSTGNSDLASDQTMNQLKVGETNKQQVRSLLGDPDSQHAIEMGGATREWWYYTYASATINPLEYLLLYGFFFNGIGLYDVRHDLGVFFDDRGVVSSLSKTKTDYDMGSPLSPLQVTSVSQKTLGFPGFVNESLHAGDRMEYRRE